MANDDHKAQPRIVGRYALYDKIASGGMASVHFGRLLGAAGFQRTVAIKRLHPQYVHDDEFATQFMDEARLAAHIAHRNVVQVLDVVSLDDELLLVMEYVHGETLARLTSAAAKRGESIPVPIATAALASALHGLHAAHEACDDAGRSLGIVHRDISPQNIMLGCDGAGRVLDFGIAKARLRVHSTEGHQLKGKLRYMAPEQVLGRELDRRTDVFAAGVVLWRLLTGKHLFGETEEPATTLYNVLHMPIPQPSSVVPSVPPELDSIAMRALCRDPDGRYPTALDLAKALTSAVPPPSADEIARWMDRVCGNELAERAGLLANVVRHSQQRPHAELRLPRAVGRANDPGERSGSVSGVQAGSVPDSALNGNAISDDSADWGTERVTGGGWLERGSLTLRAAARPKLPWRLAALGLGTATVVGLLVVQLGQGLLTVESRSAASRPEQDAVRSEPSQVAASAAASAPAERPVLDLDGTRRSETGAASAAPPASAPARAPPANPRRSQSTSRPSARTVSSAAPTPSAADPTAFVDPLRRRN